MRNRMRMGILLGILLPIFLLVTPISLAEGVAPTFTMGLPASTTYYNRTVDIQATNTTNDVYDAWFRYNNGSWSGNISMTYDSGNGWWEYETTANYWDDGDTYQIQAFMNATADAGIGMDSATMVTDTTPTFTIAHPENKGHSDIYVAVEYTVAGSVSTPWNIYDGSTFVYASNQTTSIARDLEWNTAYTLYAYAVDALGTSAVDSSRTFSVGPIQGGAAGAPITTDPTTDPPISNPISGVINWGGDNIFPIIIVAALVLLLRDYQKKKK